MAKGRKNSGTSGKKAPVKRRTLKKTAGKTHSLQRQALVAERLRFETLRAKNVGQNLSLPLFAAGVAHEFNNILGAADGHAEWALESAKPEDMKEALEIVRLACRRSSQITRSLQSLFQPFEEKVEIFSVKKLLTELKKLFAADCRRDGVNFEVQIGDEKVYGDASRIFEIFTNLTKNALSVLVTSREKNFRISAQIKGKKLRLLFADSGPGVPQIYREAIFEPFFTTKGVMAHVEKEKNADLKPVTAAGEGTGLGLFLSRQIALEHGGNLTLSPSVHGAVFELQLPLSY